MPHFQELKTKLVELAQELKETSPDFALEAMLYVGKDLIKQHEEGQAVRQLRETTNFMKEKQMMGGNPTAHKIYEALAIALEREGNDE